jgi:Tol biopolymer transport system component
LLVWARGGGWNGIYVVPQLGGRPRLIASGMVFLSCWSPDGSSIAVAGALDNKIRLFDARGQEQRTLTLQGDHWSIWDLDWSTSDRLLFASSDKQGRYTIGTIWTDGTGQQTVFSSPTEIPSTRWVPGGDDIYYLQRINQTMSLYRIAARASTEASAASGTAVLTGLETDRFFSLSADARRFVYTRAPYYSNLWLLDLATGQTSALTQGTSLIERPRFSPDGTSVVFSVGHDPRTNLYTIPANGGTPKQLTFFTALTIGGVWSPDGQRIAFASTQGGRPRIWTVGATGTGIHPLSSGALSDNFDVAWGPGRRILYQRAGNQNYYELDPDTASERLLVKDGSPGWMFAPVYSPDGMKLAVAWNRPPKRGIWIIDAVNRDETLLYPSTAATIRPINWSSDGAWIYVVDGKNGPFRGATSFVGETITEARIVRIAVNGGTAETVATIPADEIGSVTITPDGRRAIYPVFSSRSDVWLVDDFDVQLTTSR